NTLTFQYGSCVIHVKAASQNAFVSSECSPVFTSRQQLTQTSNTEALFAVCTTESLQKEDIKSSSEEKAIYTEFADVFPNELPDKLPPSRSIDHAIELTPGVEPPSKPTYKLSYVEMNELKKQLTDLLTKGFIRPSMLPFGTPVLFVHKKNGTLHPCADHRALNKVTIKNQYPLPRNEELVDHLVGSKYFSKIDSYSGYQQIRIKQEDIPKTAFRTRYGHYELLVLPCGLTNAPAIFMTLMNIRKHQLYMLCELFCKKVEYIEQSISEESITINPRKVNVIRNWSTPTNTSGIRSFLELASYYRKFISGFSAIAPPLTALLHKGQPFGWTSIIHKAFDTLKRKLSTTPVLLIPDPTKPFTLATDAFDFAIGAVLTQDHEKGKQSVTYESRKLSAAEQNYTTHEKGLLAILHVIRLWCTYLEGQQFTVITDHASLTYIKTQSNLSNTHTKHFEIQENGYTSKVRNEWRHHQISKFKCTYYMNIMIQISRDIWELIKTAEAIMRNFYWPKMEMTLENMCRHVTPVNGI
ncbi:8344_t:CDS:1, partial [Paraglomus brasilianum]